MLYEVHFLSDGAFSYDVIPRLEHLKPQFGEHRGDKVWVSIGK